MSTLERILIVGGGIAGLSLATALGQQGLRAELVERNPDWRALGAGLLVQANGIRVLRALGVGDAVEAAGTVVERWIVADQQGTELCGMNLGEVWRAVGPCIGIARSRLQRALLQGAAAIPCRLGTSITALVQAGQRVAVTFTDGSSGAYDLVVGADGIHSTVRQLAFGAVPVSYSGGLAWRSLAPLRLPGPTSVRFCLGDGCFFGLCAVGAGATYGFGHATVARQHEPVEGRLARLRERFASFGPVVRQYLAHLERDDQIHCSPVEWVEQHTWLTGRVLLIGDAAHASSPMLGQGGCMALEDAYVLAEVLRSEPTVERALATFVARRAPRVGHVHQESRAMGEAFRVPSAARNATLREHGERLLRQRFAPLRSIP